MGLVEIKARLEEKIRVLAEEKVLLSEEVERLKELVELSEKAKGLENEVNELKKKSEALKTKIAPEFMQESAEEKPVIVAEGSEGRVEDEECHNCEEEEFL